MSDFKRSDREPKVLVREPMKIQTSADPPMNQQANQYLMEQRIKELERRNELLRDACEDALLHLEEDYATFDFDAWRKSWAKDGRLHFGEKLMNKLKAALEGEK